MNKPKIYISFVVLLLTGLSAFTQSHNAYYGEIMIGKVVKHKEGLLFEVPPMTMILQAGKVIQTDGSKAWHDYWGFPRLERSVHFNVLGDAEVLGYAFGAAPGIAFYLRRGDRSSMLLHLATGFAYLNREFNAATNPTNNAIGSNFNNTSQVKISYETNVVDNVALDIGLGLTHYSNGLSSSPNSGINVIGLHLGLKPIIDKPVPTEGFNIAVAENSFRRWGINGFMTYGLAESKIPGGPKYPVKNYTLGIYYRLNPFIRLHTGVDYEYDFADYEFAIRDFQSEETANEEASSSAAFAGLEGLFGQVSFRFQLGYYLEALFPSGEPLPYTKFNIVYNIPYDLYEVQPFVGVLLKTHVGVADYVSLQVGVEW